MIRLILLIVSFAIGCSSIAYPFSRSDSTFRPEAWGAKGDGLNDDTDAVNAAIKKASSTRGTVKLTPGRTYLINGDFYKGRSIRMADHVILLATGAKLKLQPRESKDNNALISAINVNGWKIIGGELVGERHDDQKSSGGYGLLVWKCSDVQLEGVIAHGFTTDGFFFSKQFKPDFCSNISMTRCVSYDNLRQGLSIDYVHGAKIVKCDFHDNGGRKPGAGVDVEPDSDSEGVSKDVLFDHCSFKGNQIGLYLNTERTESVTVRNCLVEGNLTYGVIISAKRCELYDNRIEGNGVSHQGEFLSGIFIDGTDDHVIKGNSIIGNYGNGLVVAYSSGNHISGNTIERSQRSMKGDEGSGIVLTAAGKRSSDNVIEKNTIRENEGAGIRLQIGSVNNAISSNHLRDNGRSGGRNPEIYLEEQTAGEASTNKLSKNKFERKAHAVLDRDAIRIFPAAKDKGDASAGRSPVQGKPSSQN